MATSGHFEQNGRQNYLFSGNQLILTATCLLTFSLVFFAVSWCIWMSHFFFISKERCFYHFFSKLWQICDKMAAILNIYLPAEPGFFLLFRSIFNRFWWSWYQNTSLGNLCYLFCIVIFFRCTLYQLISLKFENW